ncbi:MAG: O-antigen ligase family protein [Prevotella sp.]|jgi:hypothetical protein|nr:O-antigen ligase family protein [Prevotella sp.]
MILYDLKKIFHAKNNLVQLYILEMPKTRFIFLLLFVILTTGTQFLSTGLFVDDKTISKWYILVFGSLAGSIIFLLTENKQEKFNIDQLALFVIISCLYFGVIIFFFTEVSDVKSIYLVCISFLFLIFRLTRDCYVGTFNLLISLICLIQAIYGLCQYFHILDFSGQFPISGSFDNPAGFSACLSIGFPFCLFQLSKSKRHQYLGIVSLSVIGLAIILSASRSGIFSVLCISSIYTFYKYKHQFIRWRKWIGTGVIILIIIISLLGLFLLKKDSASGRLLIWEVSCDMIADNFVFGSGCNSFQAKYMLYQAGYFNNNPNSKFTLLADNVLHPFNEYLNMALSDCFLFRLFCS